MTVVHPITSFKSREAAERLAASLAADDADTTYVVVERKDGRFVIEVREDGEFVGCV